MKKASNIMKTGIAVAFAAVTGFGCNGERPATNPTDDTSTSEAIVDMTDAEHLNEPRPSAIGDTAVTEEQANQFGDMNSNVDTTARKLHKLDMERQKREKQ
ncbi:hypothetical protein MKJ04_07700 [Pontibacter sp. E15-1]|uniref:hypothetical protein n=1 Tax=Pontibacter sp. E15-1 TaxID=2919918 RepID=UPI001F503E72|nr:hypothetical protein [Pontibacter sp. E15-1]MCJ8164723.1 hypothetical protein [Pontibacter sp. E15-1]